MRPSRDICDDAIIRKGPASQSARVAKILPTTRSWLAFAREASCQQAGTTTIVDGSGSRNAVRPTGLLRALASGSRPNLIIIFADQLTASSDATVLVRANRGNYYVSPLEYILHATYGYVLSFWGLNGEQWVHERDESALNVLSALDVYLRECHGLGEEWLARSVQGERTQEYRREEALRRLRFFRSAIADAFCNDPTNAHASSLLSRALAIEQKLRPEAIA